MSVTLDLEALRLAQEAHKRMKAAVDRYQALAIIQVAIRDGSEMSRRPRRPSRSPRQFFGGGWR